MPMLRRDLERASQGFLDPPRRAREERFCVFYFTGIVRSGLLGRKDVRKRDLLAIAIAALHPAGYWRRPKYKVNGEPTKLATRKARELLSMPRIQHRLDEMFEAAGMPLERCAQIMNEIAADPEQDPNARLRAIDMRVRMTVGYAPTRQQNVNVNVRGDRFFDPKVFGESAPIETDIDG